MIVVPQVAAVMIVVSENSEFLSPKSEPLTIIPIINGAGTPILVPITISMNPEVPVVPHEVSVAIEVKLHCKG